MKEEEHKVYETLNVLA